MGEQRWVVRVKSPDGFRKRSGVTSIVVDQEPTLEDIRGAVAGVARVLVDDLWAQAEFECGNLARHNRIMNELAGQEEDASGG